MRGSYNSRNLAIARLLCANLAIAHFSDVPYPQGYTIPRKNRTGWKTYDKICIQCGTHYVALRSTSKFHDDKCRTNYNVTKTRLRRKTSPQEYEVKQGEKNVAWNRFYQGITEDAPRLAGRHTRVQRTAVQDLKRTKQKLRQLKINRITSNE